MSSVGSSSLTALQSDLFFSNGIWTQTGSHGCSSVSPISYSSFRFHLNQDCLTFIDFIVVFAIEQNPTEKLTEGRSQNGYPDDEHHIHDVELELHLPLIYIFINY